MKKSTLHLNGSVLAEGGVLSALTVVLVLGCTYIPFFQLFTNFVCPLPIAFLVLRRGGIIGVMASLVTSVLIAVFLGLQGVPVALGVLAPGLVLGYGVQKKWKAAPIIFSVALATMCTMFLIVLSYGIFFKADFFSEITKIINESQRLNIEMYQKLNVPKEVLAKQEKLFAAASQYIGMILPAVFSVSALFMAFLNYIVAGKLLNRMGHILPPVPPFSHWRTPWPFSWGYIAAMLAIWAGESVPFWKQAGTNLFFVFSLWYTIQGLAIVSFYLQRTKLARLMQGCLLGVGMLFMGNLLSVGGLLDTWFDFRRLELPAITIPKEENHESHSIK